MFSIRPYFITCMLFTLLTPKYSKPSTRSNAVLSDSEVLHGFRLFRNLRVFCSFFFYHYRILLFTKAIVNLEICTFDRCNMYNESFDKKSIADPLLIVPINRLDNLSIYTDIWSDRKYSAARMTGLWWTKRIYVLYIDGRMFMYIFNNSEVR